MKSKHILISVSIVFILIVALLLSIDNRKNDAPQISAATPSASRTPQPTPSATIPAKTAMNIANQTQNAKYQATQSAGNAMTQTQGVVDKLTAIASPTATISINNTKEPIETPRLFGIDSNNTNLKSIQMDEILEIIKDQNNFYFYENAYSGSNSIYLFAELNSGIQYDLKTSALSIIEFFTDFSEENLEIIQQSIPYLDRTFDAYFRKLLEWNVNNFLQEQKEINLGSDYSNENYIFRFFELPGFKQDSDIVLLHVFSYLGYIEHIYLLDISNGNEIIDNFQASVDCRNECYLEVVQINDFTNDGINDVLLTNYSWTNWSVHRYFYLITDTMSGYQMLEPMHVWTTSETDLKDYFYDEVSKKIIVRYPDSHSWDCYWTQEIEFSWPNDELEILDENDMPSMPECLTSNILGYIGFDLQDYYQTLNNFEKAKALYIQEGYDDPELFSFILYNLATLYSIDSKTNDAQNQLEEFLNIDFDAKNIFTEPIQELLSTNQVNPYNLCEVLRENVLILSDMDAYWMFKTLGWDQHMAVYARLDPSTSKFWICDYQTILNLYINTLDKQSVTHPENYLSDYEFDEYQIIRSNGNIYLYLQNKVNLLKLTINDLGHYYWKEIYFETYERPGNQESVLINEDIDGDMKTELLVGYSIGDPIGFCEEASKTLFNIFIEDLPEEYLNGENNILLCIEPENFKKNLEEMFDGNIIEFIKDNEVTNYSVFWTITMRFILEDFNNKSSVQYPSNWYELSINENIRFQNITEYFLKAEDKSSYIDLINYLISHIETMHYSEHPISNLKYLLAMAYEEQGDECAAAEIYLELWSSEPQTIWSHLAAAHLEVVEDGQGVCAP